MIVQDITIKRVGWKVRVYHSVDYVYADEIIDELIRLGCRGEDLKKASRYLWSGLPNQGLTYTRGRETLMVIGYTTSGCEYWNTLDHERLHLLQHITSETGLDPFGEEIAYISGEFSKEVFKCAGNLLCRKMAAH